ncbi:MAG TPA: M20/M25/M40 family metallo-hydrolase [Candidatus Sulfomarinibacteraceae bacterium]|nr:M20/M25/M40 family metallo-hydrolase [Candidatus Sulfomarinibacteraceae bacterium]
MSTVDVFRARLPAYLAELRELVAIETPTGHEGNATRAAAWLGERLSPFGELEQENLAGHGPLLRLRRPGRGPRVMLVGHLDTVWPVGSWPDLWHEADGVVSGPGVYDMKGGLLFVVELLRWLDGAGIEHPSLEIVINPDEEVGSRASRHRIREIAAGCDAALVLEPTTRDGVVKVARKGSGEVVLTVHGRSAHQGVEPELGVNAVVEAAHQVLRLLELQDLAVGTTVGPNVVAAGSASNVVPDLARVEIDVRAWTAAEQRRLDAGLAALTPVLDGARLKLGGGWNRPPMEATPESMALFERARRIGVGLGLDLRAARWGGSSDGNLTAAAGTPTLDGLGPVGEGSHQRSEAILVDAVPVRLALLAELVASLVELPDPG